MQYQTRELSFPVKAGSTIAYFGELHVLFPRESEDGFEAAVTTGLTPPIATILSDAPEAAEPAKAEIYNRYADAVRESRPRSRLQGGYGHTIRGSSGNG
jgi:hypothetical protein